MEARWAAAAGSGSRPPTPLGRPRARARRQGARPRRVGLRDGARATAVCRWRSLARPARATCAAAGPAALPLRPPRGRHEAPRVPHRRRQVSAEGGWRANVFFFFRRPRRPPPPFSGRPGGATPSVRRTRGMRPPGRRRRRPPAAPGGQTERRPASPAAATSRAPRRNAARHEVFRPCGPPGRGPVWVRARWSGRGEGGGAPGGARHARRAREDVPVCRAASAAPGRAPHNARPRSTLSLLPKAACARRAGGGR